MTDRRYPGADCMGGCRWLLTSIEVEQSVFSRCQPIKEENRARWRARISNPVRGRFRLQVGSTPTLFRHFFRLVGEPPCHQARRVVKDS